MTDEQLMQAALEEAHAAAALGEVPVGEMCIRDRSSTSKKFSSRQSAAVMAANSTNRPALCSGL